jgi:glycosyltransferase involved in cell wall biosynthesis
MRILQLSTYDVAGGAEQVAMNLHRGFRAAGDEATLAVGFRQGDEPGVVALDNRAARGLGGWIEDAVTATVARVPAIARGPLRVAALAGQPRRLARLLMGREDLDMPATRHVLQLVSQTPEVLHCHNLHGGYFDLRELPRLAARVPTFLTLHDMWTLTGHCAYSLGCERWRVGCGSCPDLSIYPTIRRDATRQNLRLKEAIYAGSRLRVAAPSRWLLDRARASVLAAGVVEWRLIPYGVDLGIFNGEDRPGARARLGIPSGARVLLYAVNRANPFKDYATVEEAVLRIASAVPDVLFLVVGGGSDEQGDPRKRFVPFVRDRARLADYYRSADLFLHAAHEDNFPNTILEAQACGAPTIATAVGGVAEQVEDGATGVLVPPRGAAQMAEAAVTLLNDRARLDRMRARAQVLARTRYDLAAHVERYRSWFAETLATAAARSP